MADETHVAILKQGTSVWNKWRVENSAVRPDLSDTDLRGLNAVWFNERYYHEQDCINAELAVDYEDAERVFVSLGQIWDSNGETLTWDDRLGLNLRHADFTHARLDGADLSWADLEGAVLKDATLDHADLRYASLKDAIFCRASLESGNLRFADLTRTDLTQAFLRDTDLSNAQFAQTVLTGAGLQSTVFAGVDLSTAVGLDTLRHYGPSTIGVDTLFKSRGRLPDAFLSGAGVPESLIAFIKSQSGRDWDSYYCFISFNQADSQFVDRLHEDLWSRGVRCWQWKKSATWGKGLWREIDDAIRVSDRVIVVCSEHSLKAPGVIREISRAIEKENRLIKEGKEADVVFPLLLDDHIFDWEHELKTDLISKVAGDFRTWKNPQDYNTSLSRLIKVLMRVNE
jgi:uncharacterized protein YjbI with pentapeptide repeats